MAKFYVQSGNFQIVINADDAEKAALWAVHKVMEQVMPQSCDSSLAIHREQGGGHQPEIMVLGHEVRISEVGFDSPEQITLDTLELQTHWHQLTIALARLESMLSGKRHVNCHDQALHDLVA